MDQLVELNRTRSSNASSIGFWAALTRWWKPKPNDKPRFYGPGQILKFGRTEILSPLVYACKETLEDAPDVSLIEFGLPISPDGKAAEPLPYWPSYRAASPAQRTKYIDWLLGGRKDPQIPIGYVFIYLYGLERRSLVETLDHEVIAVELLHLLEIYSHSRSFRRYASNLLWMTIWLSLKTLRAPSTLLRKSVFATDWNEETLNQCLACYAKIRELLPNDLVYEIARRDVRSAQSVLVKKHTKLHKEAFDQRVSAEFPEGFEIRMGNRERRIDYFPASASLSRVQIDGGMLVDYRIPSILEMSSQFSSLVSIWGQTIDDLTAYDNAQKKTVTGEFTAQMYDYPYVAGFIRKMDAPTDGFREEVNNQPYVAGFIRNMPASTDKFTAEMHEAHLENVRLDQHPHFKKWRELMDRSVADDAWTIIAIGKFATIEGVAERKKLTMAQSMELAKTASQMGFAFEPDTRITGKAYEWNQVVSVFPSTHQVSQDVASYHAAVAFLELGLGVASADGPINKIELSRLTSIMELEFALSSHDAVRFAHVRYLLTIQPPHEITGAKILQKNLSLEQRKNVGEFLVGIAAADKRISPEEVKALEKAYRALGLAVSCLDKLLCRVTIQPNQETSPTQTATVFRLNTDRINAIMQETAKVTQFLSGVMREEVEPEADAAATHSSGKEANSNRTVEFSLSAGTSLGMHPLNSSTVDDEGVGKIDQLAKRNWPLLREALKQPHWERSALAEIARTYHLMLGGAIEQINEWSYESFGDAIFIELDDEIDVQLGLFDQGSSLHDYFS